MNVLLTAEVNQDMVQVLESVLDITYAGWVKTQTILTEDEMAELAVGKDILITSYDPVTRKVMDASPELKLIVCTRANPVNIDTEYAKSKGIKISYSPGRNSICTAEFTVALMLALTRKIPFAYHALKNGIFTAERQVENKTVDGLRSDVTWALGKDTPYVLCKGFQMHGHNLGIIGYGSIGREVGRLCRAFGMHLLVYDPFLNASQVEQDVKLVSLEELLADADIVTVHCKDIPETHNLVNRAFLEQMKPTAYLINTSRGALVDEAALIEILRERRIAGAALDVYESEPIAKDHPFITELDNVVITPHIAGATYDAIDFHTQQLVTDVLHFLRGESLEYEY